MKKILKNSFLLCLLSSMHSLSCMAATASTTILDDNNTATQRTRTTTDIYSYIQLHKYEEKKIELAELIEKINSQSTNYSLCKNFYDMLDSRLFYAILDTTNGDDISQNNAHIKIQYRSFFSYHFHKLIQKNDENKENIISLLTALFKSRQFIDNKNSETSILLKKWENIKKNERPRFVIEIITNNLNKNIEYIYELIKNKIDSSYISSRYNMPTIKYPDENHWLELKTKGFDDTKSTISDTRSVISQQSVAASEAKQGKSIDPLQEEDKNSLKNQEKLIYNLNTQIQNLKTQLKGAQQLSIDKNQQISALEEKIKILTEENDNQLHEKNLYFLDLQKIRQDYDELNAQLQTSQQEKDRKNLEYQQLQTEITTLQTQLAQEQAQIQNLQNQITPLNTQITTLQTQIQENNLNLLDLQQSRDQAYLRTHDLQNEITDLNTQIATLENDLRTERNRLSFERAFTNLTKLIKRQ